MFLHTASIMKNVSQMSKLPCYWRCCCSALLREHGSLSPPQTRHQSLSEDITFQNQVFRPNSECKKKSKEMTDILSVAVDHAH